MLNIKTHKTPATYHFGRKIVFDGYLIAGALNSFKSLIIYQLFLFNGYLMKYKK